MAAKKQTVRGAAPAKKRAVQKTRESRSLQIVGVDPHVAQDLDTVLWFQTLHYYAALRERREGVKKPSKEEFYDEAASAYVETPRTKRLAPTFSAKGDVKLTFWVQAKTVRELQKIAEDLGVPTTRVLAAAITQLVTTRVTPAARKFRIATERRAARLMKQSKT